jgi:hypothetical protein
MLYEAQKAWRKQDKTAQRQSATSLSLPSQLESPQA